MGMKTILVPIENHDAMQSALETALLLGRRCDSYIEGFALRWAINEFMVGDVVGGMPLETYRQDIAEEARKARQIFETFMQKHDVPRSTETTEVAVIRLVGRCVRGGKFHWQLWTRVRRDSDEPARCEVEPPPRQSD